MPDAYVLCRTFLQGSDHAGIAGFLLGKPTDLSIIFTIFTAYGRNSRRSFSGGDLLCAQHARKLSNPTFDPHPHKRKRRHNGRRLTPGKRSG
jgi:hypothetical protein